MPRPSRRPHAARPRRFASPAPRSAAEVLESRVLPAITLLVDYSLDKSGFFNDPDARRAMESVAAELGSRLTDDIPALLRGTYRMVDPSTFTDTFVEFDAPANTLRVFAAGNDLSAQSGLLAAASSLTSPAIRRFDLLNDYAPYVSFIGFGTNWNWDYDGTNDAPDAVNFRAVARHEMMHALGIGVATSWHTRISSQTNNDRFFGTSATAVNGGVAPTTSTFDGNDHFEQGNFALMQPFLSDILRPTALDWAALDDLGWDVVLPGRFADVFARSSDGTWWASANSEGLSAPYEFGKWTDDALAGWRDVGSSVDLNGDGFTDVVGRTSTGAWYAGINTSNGFENRFFGAWKNLNWQDVRFGDFNGDGKTDVAGRLGSELYVGISDGTKFTTTKWGNLPAAAVWQDVQVADFDGDARADLAFRNGAGEWYVAISGVGQFSISRWATWADSGSGAFWRDVQAVDMDTDGVADLIGRTYTGEWYVGLSRPGAVGGTFSTLRWTTWNEAAGWRDVSVGDFSGDGFIDILGRTSTGEFYVAQNVGGVQLSSIAFGRWNETRNGQNLWANGVVLTGDFTGGPRPDLLARANDGSWWLGTNNGQKLTFSAYGQWGEALGWRDETSTKKLVAAATPIDGNPDAVTSGSGSVSGPPGAINTHSAVPHRIWGQGTWVAFGANTTSAPIRGLSLAPSFAPTSPSTTGVVLSPPSKNDGAVAPAATVASTTPASTLLDLAFGDAGLLDALAAA